MNPAAAKNYWDVLAGQFQHQQPPLRPSAEDVRIFEQTLHDWNLLGPRSQINALLLGVTPEIVKLAWPAGTNLLAVEKSQPMIDLIWPGDISGRRVVRDNWFNLKMADHSLDIVIGDGVLTSLTYPDRHRDMARLISRWLKPEGRLILRVFARPTQAETIGQIVADLEARRIARFDILKWRLAMMLQKNIGEGVVLDDVYRAWTTLERGHPQLLAQAGWPAATVATIKLYAGRTERYTFPTVDELQEVFSPELRRVSVKIPGYDFGQCCPIVTYDPLV